MFRKENLIKYIENKRNKSKFNETLNINYLFKKNIKIENYTILPKKIKKINKKIMLFTNDEKNINLFNNLCDYTFCNHFKKSIKILKKNKKIIIIADYQSYKKVNKEIGKIIKRKKINFGYKYGNITNKIKELIKQIKKGKYITLKSKNNSLKTIFGKIKMKKKNIIENITFLNKYINKIYKKIDRKNYIEKKIIYSTQSKEVIYE
ncbi:MAG: hypothetical protein AAYR31_00015 [Candidatus Vidania fulgoroideorum]